MTVNRDPGYQRRQSRKQRDPGGRSILLHRAFRHMDMDILIAEIQVVFDKCRFDEGCRYRRGFLHDIAQLSGDDHVPVSAYNFRFDE